MINYSLTTKNTKPGDAGSEKKVYATTQCQKTLTAEAMADHISRHNSKYNRADILGVLFSVAQCMEEHLLEGCRVEMYEIGTFCPVVHCQAAEAKSEFNNNNITGLSVHWRPSRRFKRIYQNNWRKLSFEFASTRVSQARALKKEKEEIQAELDAARAKSVARRETSQEE